MYCTCSDKCLVMEHFGGLASLWAPEELNVSATGGGLAWTAQMRQSGDGSKKVGKKHSPDGNVLQLERDRKRANDRCIALLPKHFFGLQSEYKGGLFPKTFRSSRPV